MSPKAININGVILVSGRCQPNGDKQMESFMKDGFDYKTIKSKLKKFSIIHGDNDPLVPVSNANILAEELNGKLIIIKNGEHLNGSAGYWELPQCLETLNEMMK